MKKNVTCAYFSVSAMRSCFRPACDSTSPRWLLDFLRREEDRQRPVFAIAIHRDEMRLRTHGAVEAVEVSILERGDDLAHAVRAEVEEDERVAVFDAAEVRAVGRQHGDRLHEFVGHVLLVETPQRLQRLLRLRADAERHQVVAALHALPPLVAVHREVAADDRGQMRLRFVFDVREEIAEVLLGRLRRRVAAVEDGVNEDVLRAECDRGVDQSVQVRLQRMHAAVGEQAGEVNRASAASRHRRASDSLPARAARPPC